MLYSVPPDYVPLTSPEVPLPEVHSIATTKAQKRVGLEPGVGSLGSVRPGTEPVLIMKQHDTA